MSNEQETLKYLSAMRVIDFNKLGFVYGKETITEVLNLIENRQAEIEKLKKHNKKLLRKLKDRVKEVKKLTKYSLYKKEFTKLNREIEKKDKIIDEMAECMGELQLSKDREGYEIMTKDDWKRYFKNKVEE